MQRSCEAAQVSTEQTQPNLRGAEEKNFLRATGEKCVFCCKPESQSWLNLCLEAWASCKHEKLCSCQVPITAGMRCSSHFPGLVIAWRVNVCTQIFYLVWTENSIWSWEIFVSESFFLIKIGNFSERSGLGRKLLKYIGVSAKKNLSGELLIQYKELYFCFPHSIGIWFF